MGEESQSLPDTVHKLLQNSSRRSIKSTGFQPQRCVMSRMDRLDRVRQGLFAPLESFTGVLAPNQRAFFFPYLGRN